MQSGAQQQGSTTTTCPRSRSSRVQSASSQAMSERHGSTRAHRVCSNITRSRSRSRSSARSSARSATSACSKARRSTPFAVAGRRSSSAWSRSTVSQISSFSESSRRARSSPRRSFPPRSKLSSTRF
eukprot:Amastigsp_a174416_384.p4 type:complete len:127 gc:universal Amastigsp_a174416_384:550-170(-)